MMLLIKPSFASEDTSKMPFITGYIHETNISSPFYAFLTYFPKKISILICTVTLRFHKTVFSPITRCQWDLQCLPLVFLISATKSNLYPDYSVTKAASQIPLSLSKTI